MLGRESWVKKKISIPQKVTLQFISTLEKSTNKLWGCHFNVPKSVAQKLIDGKSRRVVCTLNGSAEHQCALLPHGNGSFVISVNKKLRDDLKLDFGMSVQVSLRKDDSRYGLPMPEELEELLHQDKEGHRLFHSLTPGRLRTLLYIVGQAKNSDNRIARALMIVQHLKAHKGKINYRQLNVTMRDSRR